MFTMLGLYSQTDKKATVYILTSRPAEVYYVTDNVSNLMMNSKDTDLKAPDSLTFVLALISTLTVSRHELNYMSCR